MMGLKATAREADSGCMRHRRPSAQAEHGFSLVELMVAVMVLIVGILGVMTMVDIANRTTGDSNARVAATNLAREVVENVRSVDYGDLVPGRAESELQLKPGLAGAGNPWSVKRRGVTYSLAVETCTFDDPRDGAATAGNGPVNPCAPSTVAPPAGVNEQNPDDFRRVTVTLSWRRQGRNHSVQQTEMVVNPSGSLGPRIISLYEPPGEITAGTFIDFPVKTTTATAVRWSVNQVAGDANNGPTDWTFRWDLGATPGTSGYVVDGVYTVTAQAFDARNIPGDARFSTVLLNRGAPEPVQGFEGGRNDRHGGIVDMRWSPSAERDIRGYRVYRLDASGAPTLICDVGTSESLTCTDEAPPSGTVSYELRALDLLNLDQAASPLREGTGATLTVGAVAGMEPATPVPGGITVTDGLPRFDWTQPAGGTILFTRVYRKAGVHSGSVCLCDRYAVTFTAASNYQDPAPLTGQATYWFAAVDVSFNESPASAPVVYP